MARSTNLEGDQQADLEHHGGIDKAVLAYSAEHYPLWLQELEMEIPFGGFGENLTIAQANEESVCIGDRWSLGGAVFVVSQPRQPCWKLARRWRRKELPALVVANGRCGWYLRVVQEGSIAAGQTLELLERPNPDWSVARAHHTMHHQRNDLALRRALAALPQLSATWRATLSKAH